jgi:hypothetical protein
MSTPLAAHKPAKPAYRLTLKRFVFGEDRRVIYAASEQEAQRLIDSEL